MRKDDLRGVHVTGDAWHKVRQDWNDAGLRCARFDIPESRKEVIIEGSSLGADPCYCVRIIRIDVKKAIEE